MNSNKTIPELGDSHSITGLGSAPGVAVNCTAEQPFWRHGTSHTALRFTVNYNCIQLSRKKKKKKIPQHHDRLVETSKQLLYSLKGSFVLWNFVLSHHLIYTI